MKTKKKIRHKAFQIWAIVILGILSVIILLPFILMVLSSLTDENTLLVNGYSLFPEKFSIEAYVYIFRSGQMILKAYGLSIIITIIGTTCALTLTCLMAYPLSRKDFKYRKLFSFIVYFTMLFNGGLVSQYMMWTTIFKIKNTIFAYLIPNLMMNAFNVMIVRNYLSENIPREVIESAKMDGAGEWYTYHQIVRPMAKPIMVAIGLIIGLAYWNDWVNGLYYVNNTDLYTFQNLLNRMIQQVNYLTSGQASEYRANIVVIPAISLRMAIAALGVVPILTVYPFFQKYFAKGLTMGAVKG